MISRIDRQAMNVIGLLVGAVAVGVLIGMPETSAPAAGSVVPPPAVPESGSRTIVLHVSGEVESPGLVEVRSDVRVADVVAAAGGATVLADLSGLNLAGTVVDGQQIVVPSRTGSEVPGAVGGDTRVRINHADASTLEGLPGVGPVLAGSIIAHRAEYGPFRDAEDLLDVPGIGEQKLASLRDHVIVP